MTEVYEWVRRRSGEEVRATVTDCRPHGAAAEIEIDGDRHEPRYFMDVREARQFVLARRREEA